MKKENDLSCFHFYKGEMSNPFEKEKERPLAAVFWRYERKFYMDYIRHRLHKETLQDAYGKFTDYFFSSLLPFQYDIPGEDRALWRSAFYGCAGRIDRFMKYNYYHGELSDPFADRSPHDSFWWKIERNFDKECGRESSSEDFTRYMKRYIEHLSASNYTLWEAMYHQRECIF